MDKKEGFIERKAISEKDFSLLKQLINSLESLEKKLEDYYKRNNSERIEKTSQSILDLHHEIEELLK